MDFDTDSNSDLEFPAVLNIKPVLLKPTPSFITSSDRPVMMTISSDSEDETPYVPLALRLKQQQQQQLEPRDVPSPTAERSPTGFTEIRALQNGSVGETVATSRARAGKRSVGDIRRSEVEEQWRRQQMEKEKQRRGKEQEKTLGGGKEQEKTQRGGKEQEKAQRGGKEQEKAQRRAMAAAVKALRPEECLKYMVAVVDPALLQLEGGGALLSSLQALGCSCAIEKQPLPRSVSWRRRTPGAQSDTDADGVPEDDVVIQMTVDDFINLSHSYIQEEQTGRVECGCTLTSWVQQLQKRNPGKRLSLVVLGLEQYFRSHKSQSQKKLREAVVGEEGGGKRKRKNGAAASLPELSRVELEEAVVHLQLHTAVCVRFLSTWKDFTEHITMATKAVAEAPFKRERDNTSFSFHLESEWAGGQRVERGGGGLLQVWRRQLQQLHRVSADMASAVLSTYASPQLLTEAYSSCRTDQERMSLLSDIQIRRGEGVTSTVRRVGPELSKRLCVLLTSGDPEHTLGTSG